LGARRRTSREHDEIAVAAFPKGIELSSLTVWWKGPLATPAVTPLQRVAWQEFAAEADAATASLRLLARSVARRRHQSYRRCAGCAQSVAPEHRNRIHGRYLCNGCQELHGVVY
jgi:hypothetical protein